MRDLLTWVHFMNATSPPLPPSEAFYHGAHLVLFDSLGFRTELGVAERESLVEDIERYLQELLVRNGFGMIPQVSPACISCDGDLFGIHPFFINKGFFVYVCPIH